MRKQMNIYAAGIKYTLRAGVVAVLLAATPAVAQDAAPIESGHEQQDQAQQDPSGAAPVPRLPDIVNVSFLFSAEEQRLIQAALEGKEVSVAGGVNVEDAQPVIPPIRRIRVAGVFYRGPDDWTVWINGQKVTPDNLLPEIVGIRVDRNIVTLQWFDVGLNGIVHVRLRPHQVYDIVTGVTLPG